MNLLWNRYHPDLPPVLRQLSETPPMLRLKQVGMNCGCEYTAFPRFQKGRDYSRYDHSLGVGLIVWHFTRDAAQAAAGLLHDISTPVFAHVVDFLRGDYLTQESTEDGTRERIADSRAIQEALSAAGLCTEDVADYHRYPIADNDSPRLSADRLEYTLGNAVNYGFLTLDRISALYEDLIVGAGEDGAPELMFRTPEAGVEFARTALCCAKVYVSDEDRYSMQILSELLARGCREGILRPEDLNRTEPEVIGALRASSLAGEWESFCRMHTVQRAPLCPDARPWRVIPAKKRFIDPLISGVGRVSGFDPAFARELADFRCRDQSEWILGE